MFQSSYHAIEPCWRGGQAFNTRHSPTSQAAVGTGSPSPGAVSGASSTLVTSQIGSFSDHFPRKLSQMFRVKGEKNHWNNFNRFLGIVDLNGLDFDIHFDGATGVTSTLSSRKSVSRLNFFCPQKPVPWEALVALKPWKKCLKNRMKAWGSI